MKIIIEKGKISREIDGAFNICGSKEDLENLALQLNEGLKHDFYYGWIKIRVEQKLIANSKPISWEEEPPKTILKGLKGCSCRERNTSCVVSVECLNHNHSHYKNSEVCL